MGSTVYKKPYSKAEFNFSLQIDHNGDTIKEVLFSPNLEQLEIELKNVLFRKTDSAGGDVIIQVDILELEIEPTGGTEYTNYLSANKDRTQNDVEGLFEILENATIDETGSRNIFRSGGVADDEIVTYSSQLDFIYKLNPKKWYLVKSEVLDGADDFAESIVYGSLRLIQ